MPVGTRGTVKGLTPVQLGETGSEICLGNTYHLHVGAGDKVIRKLGGLHQFMGWNRPILTDSGGFQVFSLPRVELTEEGVTFRFEKSGKPIHLTPEDSLEIQANLGSDIAMAFDVCVPFPCEYKEAREGVERTIRWLERCVESKQRPDQGLFGIVQGSTYPDLRVLSGQLTTAFDLPGFAIGGVSVGETHSMMMRAVELVEPGLPAEKPRYLMGVGYPEDIIEAVARGMDMFDCVVPTRLARSGVIFTRQGRYRVTKGRYRSDRFPLDTHCACYACRNFSRGYVHHLINSKELLGSSLATLHNITFYQDLMRGIRASIVAGTFDIFRRAFHQEYLTSERRDELSLEEGVTSDERGSIAWDTTHSIVPNRDILTENTPAEDNDKSA
jgi:queuine tRNA-ribosyltransferase